MIVKTDERLITHPFEEILDITPHSTLTEFREIVVDTPVEMPNYDQKDDEIEQKIEEVYALALGTVSLLSDSIDTVEGRYKASLAEQASANLGIALGAIKEKRLLKEHKDKLHSSRSKGPAPGNITNNIIGSRNDILQLLQDMHKQ
jgi:hypothetical protein